MTKPISTTDEQAGEMAVKLKCPRPSCGHVWTYNGARKFTTSCPNCKTTVTIEKNTVKEDSA
jgi:hypothetical protein